MITHNEKSRSFLITNSGNTLSSHARDRMHARCISVEQINTVLQFGRSAHVRGATVYAIGKHEAEYLRRLGVKADRLEGLQVVCDPCSETILTVYRNYDLSSLRKKNRYYDKSHHNIRPYFMAA